MRSFSSPGTAVPGLPGPLSSQVLGVRLEDLDARLDIGRRLVGMVLELNAEGSLELDVAQRLEDRFQVERALAEDDVMLLLVVVVLEMCAKVARPHDADLFCRVELLVEWRLGGTNDVASVD